ncbi:MAG: phosphate/phosphite/phosphonate ABC transporter substrate-binding protein [Gammaproteobacteria bacterium]|nr:phosphate/phosphite/phosphonate ABC transporter substrate-binding protein [Gammaproteobacteria bacterium]
MIFTKSRNVYIIFAGLMTVILLFPTSSSRVSAEKQEYVLGVFPHLPPRELEKVFSPMAADIAKAIGKPIIFRTSSTYKKFMQQLDKQVFDIAFVQPFDYVRAADKYGYLPLATRQEKLSAIIVTKKGSSLLSIDNLKNKTISLPPKVAAVSHLIKDQLKSHGLIPGKNIKLSHHRSHVSCMQQVLIGSADACGTAAPALRFFQHKMKVEMKTIGKSKSIPHTLFAIHPRIPNKEKQIILNRILGWGNTSEGKKMLARGRLKPLREITDDKYNIVRQMSK